MAQKNTSGFEALQKMNDTANNPEKKIPSDKESELKSSAEPKKKGKAGRKPIDPSGKKKKDYTKTINIAIPLDMMEKVNVAKVCYDNNVTTYINKLVEKDIAANYDNYKHIADSLNIFK